MKKIALALSLMLVLSACGTPSSIETQQPSQDNNSISTSNGTNESTGIEPSALATEEVKELPRPLTKENYKEFIKIAESQGEIKHWNMSENCEFDWILYDGVLIIYYDGDLNFPDIYDVPWKDNMDQITEFILSDGCTSIFGDENISHFMNFKNLKSVILPDGFRGGITFRECENLEYVYLPESMTGIVPFMFAYCSNLRNIDIPSTTTEIGEYAFKSCTNLEHIDIPASVEEIPDCAFMYCKNLKDVILPEGIKKICKYAFYDCTNLNSINIPSTVDFISRYSFGKSNLHTITNNSSRFIMDNGVLLCPDEPEKSYVIKAENSITEYTIPDGYNEICDGAFMGCEKLESITFTKYVRRIGDSAFEGCTNLKNVNITESSHYYSNIEVAYGIRIFANCKSLTEEVPLFITALGEEAYYGCTGIKEIYIENAYNSLIETIERRINLFKGVNLDVYLGYSRTLNSNIKVIAEHLAANNNIGQIYYWNTETGEITPYK